MIGRWVLGLSIVLLGGCALTGPTEDPAGPRLYIPPEFTHERYLDLQGFSGPQRSLELHVNGRPRSTATADEEGGFRFDGVRLHPGLNILRVILLPTEEELARRMAVIEEHRYEPPPFAQVRVVFTRHEQP